MRDKRNITFTTCTRTNGCRHLTTTIQHISIVRRLDQATRSTEITYGGSGNRNKVVGDSIFHCHFYPHFAQGMWELWRAHDVFEAGTVLDANGFPFQALALYLMVRFSPAHQRPRLFHCQHWQWRRCQQPLCRAIRSSVRQ